MEVLTSLDVKKIEVMNENETLKLHCQELIKLVSPFDKRYKGRIPSKVAPVELIKQTMPNNE